MAKTVIKGRFWVKIVESDVNWKGENRQILKKFGDFKALPEHFGEIFKNFRQSVGGDPTL